MASDAYCKLSDISFRLQWEEVFTLLQPSPILKVILKICTENMVDENVSDLFLSILLDLLIKLNIFNMHICQENSVFKKI